MSIFADVQYYIYADVVGGSKKVQKYADVIQGWSPWIIGELTFLITASPKIKVLTYISLVLDVISKDKIA